MNDYKTISENPENAIVLFDGVCNFCNSTINFVMDRNKKNNIYFLPLQEDKAGIIIKEHLLINDLSTIIVKINGKFYYSSTGVLLLLRKLDGLWPLLYYPCILVPRIIRDYCYSIIAKNRYRWFGKMESCRVPTKEDRERFI